MLSYVFPSHFLHEDILSHLISFLDLEDEVAPLVLSVLTFLGKYRPIGKFLYYVRKYGSFEVGTLC